jgi:hypothetical protein
MGERTNTPTFCRHLENMHSCGSRPTVEWNETDYDVVGARAGWPDIDYVGSEF